MNEIDMSFLDQNLSDSRAPVEYVDTTSDASSSTASTILKHLPRFTTVTSDIANVTLTSVVHTSLDNFLETVIVTLYVSIFLLSVIGNSLVLITLARNKRMRTVTNVYLLNLAVSDLLLGVFCMPFTLLGQILKNFVFGLTMCKLISYFQAVSVSVGVWTLVAISLERYFAICHPLKSRRWQTQFHAKTMIAVVWMASLTFAAPILFVSRLQSIRGGTGRQKCREEWPSVWLERTYNIFLDATLLLVPLVVMSLAYSLIAIKLWRGLKREIRQTSHCQRGLERCCSTSTMRNSTYANNDRGSNATVVFNACGPGSRLRREFSSSSGYFQGAPQGVPSRVRVSRAKVSRVLSGKCQGSETMQGSRVQIRANGSGYLTRESNDSGNEDQQDSTCPLGRQQVIRSNYMEKSIEAKKKVIRMLFVIVLEFFICWAPLHVINTWYLFAPELVYSVLGSTGISLIQLVAYVSSCCNPITYGFMNKKFRQAFLGLFGCHRCWRVGCREDDAAIGVTRNAAQVGNNSEISGNDSTVYLGRTSLVARSEVVRLLEEEDRV